MQNKLLVLISVILGLAFFIIGYIYATRAAGALPSFFPGYSSGAPGVHAKHAIAAFVVGAGCLIYAWFRSGSSSAT